ncbi:hypothetical protein ALC62_09343 [Cyphomyrmex costatus]|uniref:Uncharacterized protein n=1 Tax=Cyphomyrmex costatus TaxID=456900 RepID=A0A195CG49_9HYME|nr:hypothetical protein ALC62_09343 [Cyphomyrmex costatus]
MTTEVAPARNGDCEAVTGLPVQFDNALNVHFPRARPCVRIRNPPPAAPVARWPMTDAHGVKVNVSPTGGTLLQDIAKGIGASVLVSMKETANNAAI